MRARAPPQQGRRREWEQGRVPAQRGQEEQAKGVPGVLRRAQERWPQ